MIIKRTGLARVTLAASAATWLIATPAHAQESEAAQEIGIADIVVTAQKREENLQDTPISMVALGSEALEQKGIGSLSDLFTGAVPSIRIAPFVGRVSAVSIGMRGLVPVDATQVTRDATVGVYVDSVYLGRVSGLGMELADIERIEVLRGPQGTLFGRNTIGGAISVVSKRPTGELGFDMKAGIGNYRGRSFAAHVNLPEAAGISVKVDGVFEGRDGLVQNPLGGDARDYGEIEKYGFKISALLRPADNVSILYSYDLSRDKSTSLYHYITATDQSPANTPSFITLDTGRVKVGRIGLPVYRNPQEAKGHSLTAEWEISDALTLRSISAWRNLDSTQMDGDEGSNTSWGPGRRFGRLSYANVTQNQFSQEVQLVGDVGELKFVFGGYYFKENGRDEAIVYSLGTLNPTLTGVNLFPEPSPDGGAALPDRAADVRVRSKALFGQATWSPEAIRGLHLTAGARYTDDHKDGRLLFIRGADPDLSFIFDSSRVDPMATVAYDFSEDINAYVKWSRAYRAGGANTRSTILRTFGEEELTAWEAGVKADLFERRLRVNLAAYASRLSNQQVDFVNPAFVSNTETVNAPEKRKIKGIEADITLAPLRGLSLSANYVYTDAPSTPVRNVFTGEIEEVFSAFTPKHSASFSADYLFPAFSFGQLRAHVGLDTAGNYIPNGTVENKAEKALLLNARLSLGEIELGGGEMEVAVWGKNLTNTTYNLLDFRIRTRATTTFYNEPRTYGLEARVKF